MRPNRLTLRFAEASLEETYIAEGAPARLRWNRAAGVAVVAMCGAFTLAVRAGLVHDAVLTSRDAIVGAWLLFAAPLVVGMVLTFTRARRFVEWIAAGIAVVHGIALAGTFSLARGGPSEAPALALCVFQLYNVFALIRLRFPIALGTGALIVGGSGAAGLVAGGALAALVMALLFAATGGYLLERSSRGEWLARREVLVEKRRADELLGALLPEAIAERLKRDRGRIADRHDGLTILFADLAGFTPLAERTSPEELVTLLDEIFSEFDELAERFGLEKIKTIGDAYMAVAGLPAPRPDHAAAAADMAMAMHAVVVAAGARMGRVLTLRIGLHSGPAVAGVLGRKKPFYDLWGDTVNTAARMEAHGLPGEIHVSEATRTLLQPTHHLRLRGVMDIKGKGMMETWLLDGRADSGREPSQGSSVRT